MNEEIKLKLLTGYQTAYIDETIAADPCYKPEFISNKPAEGKKVISTIEEELLQCDQFQISVAFITLGGITPLLQILKELEKRCSWKNPYNKLFEFQ